jgi:MoaA/NifB/PqqE/SkfB family radical SAM enzyme
MVDYLKRANVTESIWMKTNGWLLTPDLSAALIDSGIDMIGVSVKGIGTDMYKSVSQVEINYPSLIEKVTNLYRIAQGRCKVYVSIADTGLSEAQRIKFYEDFEGRCDYAAIEGLHGWSASSVKDFTLGTQPTTFDGLPLVDKIVCPWIFYTQAVNWDGSVSVCNEDWMHGAVVGDARYESMVDIWHGARLRKMQRMHLEGRRGEHKVCGDCYYLKCAPDNIDAARLDILGRL